MQKQFSKFVSVLIWLLLLGSLSSFAQQPNNCVRSERTDPARIVYRCAGGLVLEAEAAAALGIQGSGATTRPDTVELTKDGLLIEVTPGSGPFRIRTPHAIAAVRGTLYIVDVSDTMTSVFVERGEVAVSRSDGSDMILLSAGMGVDVSDDRPVEATRWPSEKVAQVMARFAR